MKIEKIEPPKVRMYAIRKKPKNVPVLSTLTYWMDDLRVLEPDEEIVEVLIRVVKKSRKVKWEKLPDYGDLMTLASWISCVEQGGFIDYDGFGHYSDGKRMTDIMVKPSDLSRGIIDTKYTHIVWFNR